MLFLLRQAELNYECLITSSMAAFCRPFLQTTAPAGPSENTKKKKASTNNLRNVNNVHQLSKTLYVVKDNSALKYLRKLWFMCSCILFEPSFVIVCECLVANRSRAPTSQRG